MSSSLVRTHHIGGLILALGLGAPSLAAACSTWDVKGLRTIKQSNGITVYANLRQEGRAVSGTAAWTEVQVHDGESVGTGHSGGVKGTLDGARFEAVVTWSNGSVGVYSGQIGADGRISGINYDRRRPDIRVTWHTTEPFRCADAPKKTVTLGKKKSKPLDPPVARTKGATVSDVGVADPRTRVSSASAAAAIAREAPATCLTGYVWRMARENDFVCVVPEARELAAQENRVAPQRWNPAGAYGPKSCISGFVWREAFKEDTVCVTPERREAVREENRLAASRRAAS
jgi:hypothetical protein